MGRRLSKPATCPMSFNRPWYSELVIWTFSIFPERHRVEESLDLVKPVDLLDEDLVEDSVCHYCRSLTVFGGDRELAMSLCDIQ